MTSGDGHKVASSRLTCPQTFSQISHQCDPLHQSVAPPLGAAGLTLWQRSKEARMQVIQTHITVTNGTHRLWLSLRQRLRRTEFKVG